MNTLTIAIPTYQRADRLERQLRALCALKGIESTAILVSDNASTDRTPQVVNSFTRLLPGLRYRRNEENLGFDRNIEALYHDVRTDYVWFLSDDDFFSPDVLFAIRTQIVTHQPSVLCLNPIVGKKPYFATGYIDISPYHHSEKGRQVEVGLPYDCSDPISRLVACMTIGFVTSCVLRRRPVTLEAIHTGGIAHVALANQLLREKGATAMITADALVGGLKPDYSSWFLESTLFGVHLCFHSAAMDIPEELADDYSRNVARYAYDLLESRYRRGAIPIKYPDLGEWFEEKARKIYGDKIGNYRPMIERAMHARHRKVRDLIIGVIDPRNILARLKHHLRGKLPRSYFTRALSG